MCKLQQNLFHITKHPTKAFWQAIRLVKWRWFHEDEKYLDNNFASRTPELQPNLFQIIKHPANEFWQGIQETRPKVCKMLGIA